MQPPATYSMSISRIPTVVGSHWMAVEPPKGKVEKNEEVRSKEEGQSKRTSFTIVCQDNNANGMTPAEGVE